MVGNQHAVDAQLKSARSSDCNFATPSRFANRILSSSFFAEQLLMVCAMPAFGQMNTAEISGLITDLLPVQPLIAGASIVAVEIGYHAAEVHDHVKRVRGISSGAASGWRVQAHGDCEGFQANGAIRNRCACGR